MLCSGPYLPVCSKRQYVYKFGQWGKKKYRVDKNAASPSNFAPTPTDSDDADFESDDQLSPASSSTYDASSMDTTVDCDEEDELAPTIITIKYALSPDEEKQKLAADFLAAMSDDKNAHPLYYHLSTALVNRPESTPEANEILLTHCYRTAENIPDASQKLSELRVQIPGSDKQFVFSVLAASLQDADGSKIQDQMGAIMKKVLSQGADNLAMFSSYHALDVVAYQCLSHCKGILAKLGQASDHIFSEYVSDQRRYFGDDNFSLVRPCLGWCLEQLNSNVSIPRELASHELASIATDSHQLWRDNAQVFCTLADVIFRAFINGSVLPTWYRDCEAALGIGGFELLASVCRIIGNSADTAFDTDAAVGDDVLTRAKAKAQAVARENDPKLWREFLKPFATMKETAEPLKEDEAFEQLLFDHKRRYVTAALGIQLPVPAREDLPAKEDLPTQEDLPWQGNFDSLPPLFDFDEFSQFDAPWQE